MGAMPKRKREEENLLELVAHVAPYMQETNITVIQYLQNTGMLNMEDLRSALRSYRLWAILVHAGFGAADAAEIYVYVVMTTQSEDQPKHWDTEYMYKVLYITKQMYRFRDFDEDLRSIYNGNELIRRLCDGGVSIRCAQKIRVYMRNVHPEEPHTYQHENLLTALERLPELPVDIQRNWVKENLGDVPPLDDDTLGQRLSRLIMEHYDNASLTSSLIWNCGLSGRDIGRVFMAILPVIAKAHKISVFDIRKMSLYMHFHMYNSTDIHKFSLEQLCTHHEKGTLLNTLQKAVSAPSSPCSQSHIHLCKFVEYIRYVCTLRRTIGKVLRNGYAGMH